MDKECEKYNYYRNKMKFLVTILQLVSLITKNSVLILFFPKSLKLILKTSP